MNRLPKFLIEDTTPKDSPIIDAAEAWGNFEHQYRVNNMGIQLVLNQAIHSHYSRKAAPDESYEEQSSFLAIHIEENLRTVYPEFVIAAEGLRKALDELKGKAITWNHYQRGEVVDLELTDFATGPKGDAYGYTVKREPTTFPEDTAFLIDHHIGPSAYSATLTNTYPLWLEINYEPTDTHGLNLLMDEMFAIREAQDPKAS